MLAKGEPRGAPGLTQTIAVDGVDEVNATRAPESVMFAVKGRSWVALGDSVEPPEAAPGLILRPREMVDGYDEWAVFSQVDGEHLSWCVDAGFNAVKIGEEFHSFQGLRQFKHQLDPVWQPK
ncbi:MAG: DUF2156 domain-containing protein [Verrucomicrobia bacterium]|nr:DUF2156 domain-containing protein [Verrucomicrobiota bacterium]